MSAANNAPQNDRTYFIDAEIAAEMARLTRQDRLITKCMGGLLPEHADISSMHTVLDIACGSGGWVLDVARSYPTMQVVGVDISELMIEYASATALNQRVANASFRVMNALKPLDFADNSFDLVNARFLFAFMPAVAWPQFIQECLRITRPGGILRLTEFDVYGATNSPACEKMTELGSHAFKRAGHSFSPDGRSVGITPMLGRFLRDAACRNIQQKAHALEFSQGTEIYEEMYQNHMIVLKLMQPFLIKTGVTTQEEVEGVYHRALAEMQSKDFCGIWYFLTAIGEKTGPA